MGRQPKVGLEFWLRDVRLFRDPKLRKPRQEFGYLAPYIYECLLDILYSDKGYYIDFRGSARDDVIWELTELTQGRYAVTAETMTNVIDSLVACGLFSDDLYKRGFITSKRAQRGYFSATLGRSSVRVNFDIWLLSEDDMRELNPSGKSSVLQSFISWREKHISGREKAISQPESTQSRVEQRIAEQRIEEKSREDESREQQSRVSSELIDDLERILNCSLDRNFRVDISRLAKAGMQSGVFMAAAERTAQARPGNKAGYLRTILQGYERDGIYTTADLDATQGKADHADQDKPGDKDRPLDQWERDWLADIERRRQRDKEAIQ